MKIEIECETFILTKHKTLLDAITYSVYEYDHNNDYDFFNYKYKKVDRKFIRNITKEYKKNYKNSLKGI